MRPDLLETRPKEVGHSKVILYVFTTKLFISPFCYCW